MPDLKRAPLTPRDGMNHLFLTKHPDRTRTLAPYVRGLQQFGEVFKTVSRTSLPETLGNLSARPATGAAGQFYDSYLVMDRSGPRVIVFMNVHFHTTTDTWKPQGFFRDWTFDQKLAYASKWKQVVKAKWDTPNLTTSPDKKAVSLSFHFNTHFGRVKNPNDHWSIAIDMNPGLLQRSWISRIDGAGSFSSEDLQHEKHGDWHPLRPGIDQTTAQHEFVHMLGHRADEYRPSHPLNRDEAAIGNKGSEVRPRYLSHIKAWAESVMTRLAAYSAQGQ